MGSFRPPTLFFKRGNTSKVHWEIQRHNETSDILFPNSNNIQLVPFASVYILSALLNFKAIHTVYSLLSRRQQVSSLPSVLVTNLSVICIGLTILSILNTIQSQKLVPTLETPLRYVLDFLEDTFTCGFSINTILLAHEQVRTHAEPIWHFREPLNVINLVGPLWFWSCLVGFLTVGLNYLLTINVLAVKLAAQIFGVTFATIRYIVLYLSVVLFFTHVWKSRKRVHPPSKLSLIIKRRIEKFYAFCIRFGIFILFWECYGVWNIIHRIAFILEFGLEQYPVLVNYIKLGVHLYQTLNPIIYANILLNCENTEVTFSPNAILTWRGNLESDEKFEEKIAKDDELDTPVKVTYPEAIEEQQMTELSVVADVHSSPQILPFNRESAHFPDKIDNILGEKKKGILKGKDSKMTEKDANLCFSNTVELKYYDKESWYQSRECYSILSGESEI